MSEPGTAATGILIGQIPYMLADDVPVLNPDMPVAEAAKRLNENRVGLAVIQEQEIVLGVLSKTDIVRATAEWPSKISDLNIKHLYSKNPMTCTKTDEAVSVLKLMKDRDIRHVPLVEENKLIGLVSYDNLSSYLAEGADGPSTGPWEIPEKQSVEDKPLQTSSEPENTDDEIDWSEEDELVLSRLHEDEYANELDDDISTGSHFGDDIPDPTPSKRNRFIPYFLELVVIILIAVGGIFYLAASEGEFSVRGIGQILGLVDGVGDGLAIMQVRSSRETSGGVDSLVVRGVVTNVTKRAVSIPPVKVILYSGSGEALQSETVTIQPDRILPGTKRTFRAAVSNPSVLARRMEVTFSVGPKDTTFKSESQN